MLPPDELSQNLSENRPKKRARGAKTRNSRSATAPYQAIEPIVGSTEDVEMSPSTPITDGMPKDIPPKGCILHCAYCHDVGPNIWRCVACHLPVCVATTQSEGGCIDASPHTVTRDITVSQDTFRCPYCCRKKREAVPYAVRGYGIRNDFIRRNPHPLLGLFFTWSGFGRQYGFDMISRSLKEHFELEEHKLRMTSRAIRSGNSKPEALKPDFEWLEKIDNKSNLLVFVSTHCDTATGDLVVGGNSCQMTSVGINEFIDHYLGEDFRTASTKIHHHNQGSTRLDYTRGLVLCSCGETARGSRSMERLQLLVEFHAFDFILVFAGVSTIEVLIIPALSRFIENVFIFDLNLWTSLEKSFGEDTHALNVTPVVLCFRDPGNSAAGHVQTRMMALASFRECRPWGLDLYRCRKCHNPAYNMVFNASGHKYSGSKWLQTKMKYECLHCKHSERDVEAPGWVHPCSGENMFRVWYNWPLTSAQLAEVGA